MMRTRLMQGVLGFTALTLLVGSFKIMGSKPTPPPPTTVTVSRGVVLASVNATGNVAVSDQLALDFPVGGKVIDIYVKEGQRVVAGQPLASIDDAAARAKVDQARADVDAAQENVRKLLVGSTPNEQHQNNTAIDAARSGLTKAGDTVARAQDTLKTGSATRQNVVNDARRNLDNAKANAAQHAKDLQLDIDQIQERLDEHTAQLNIHQAKYDFDSAQADSARGAELETLQRIDAMRAILVDIEDRMRDKKCSTGAEQGVSGGQTTDTTTGAAGTRSNVTNPLTLDAAAAKTTSTTTKGKGGSGNSKECERLAEQHDQVELDLRHEEDQLQVIRQDRNRYEGYVRDDAETLIQDRQTVEQDERDLADAKNALRLGQIEDQKKVNDAEDQLNRGGRRPEEGGPGRPAGGGQRPQRRRLRRVRRRPAGGGQGRPGRAAEELRRGGGGPGRRERQAGGARRLPAPARRHDAGRADRRDRGGHRRPDR